MPVFSDNLQTTGRTPLVRIGRMARGLNATVLAKIEGRNPAYSVKCRIGAAMILDAEMSGRLRTGIQVVEATSGNTGIALAFACAARGYRLTLVMPDTMSLERRTLLRAFGAQLVLTPGNDGMSGAIRRASEMAAEPGWFMPQQFDNPANPRIHFTTTAPEIWNDTGGNVDVLVCGVGTGGTITGVGQYLKREKRRSVHIVAVEPSDSPVLSGGSPGKHRIQGIGAGFIPGVLDRTLIDSVVAVTDDMAITTARRLMIEEGISCGISCGAAMAATLEIAGQAQFSGKTIVTVLPDAGERYLSTALFEPYRTPTGMAHRPELSPYPFDSGDD